MAKELLLGSDSFWEMLALARAGRLASCQSCVEYYYFQSKRNTIDFLESCVVGRLVERVSLLDLYGDLAPRPNPTLRQQWYDEPIYISAPIFRKQYPDEARERIEITKRLVYSALRLYYEELGADDAAISAAHMKAVEDGMLRYSDIARMRQDVDMSPVARLRLIQDGYGNLFKNRNPKPRREEIEKYARENTVAYVKKFSGTKVEPGIFRDHSEELDTFIEEFLLKKRSLNEFWRDGFGEEYRLKWLPVIGELLRRRYDDQSDAGLECAQRFLAKIKAILQKAQSSADESYNAALSQLSKDLDHYISESTLSLRQTIMNSNEPSIDLHTS